jgi:hypothetical protein
MKQLIIPCEELEGWFSEQPLWTVAEIQTYFQLVMTSRALGGLQLEREREREREVILLTVLINCVGGRIWSGFSWL